MDRFSEWLGGPRVLVKRDDSLAFPLFVKSLVEEGSVGISQSSIVNDDKELADRVNFIHEKLSTDAIAEQYINSKGADRSGVGDPIAIEIANGDLVRNLRHRETQRGLEGSVPVAEQYVHLIHEIGPVV